MNRKNNEIYKVGQKVGLNKKEIENILKNNSPANQLTSQSLEFGPDPPYWASLYGSISTRNFE
ncbi:MAG: hypothetical protein JSW62_02790 [Thermoplasmatales archaeon]|nr:MAG: hypothetical protein JSW62_02790 [Thermoplasmatales archaeon]